MIRTVIGFLWLRFDKLVNLMAEARYLVGSVCSSYVIQWDIPRNASFEVERLRHSLREQVYVGRC